MGEYLPRSMASLPVPGRDLGDFCHFRYLFGHPRQKPIFDSEILIVCSQIGEFVGVGFQVIQFHEPIRISNATVTIIGDRMSGSGISQN